MLKKFTVFNFLLISQMIQKVMQSNFSKLILNMHISKIPFLLEKKIILGQTFVSLKCPKIRPLLDFLSQSVPKVQEIKCSGLM